MHKAQSSINYIKFVTPKRERANIKLDDEEDDLKSQNGKGTYILENGKWVPGKATRLSDIKATNSNWMDGNIDPDDLARHQYLVDRQFFGGRGAPRPRSPFDPRGSSETNHDLYTPALIDLEDIVNPTNNGDELDKFGPPPGFPTPSTAAPGEAQSLTEMPKF